MRGEFPTLEAAAALGVLVVVLRAVLLERSVNELDAIAARMGSLLARGRTQQALELCDRSINASYVLFAQRLIRSGGDLNTGLSRSEAVEELNGVLDLFHQREERRVQSGRARDLIVLAVLAGAALYAAFALSLHPLFYLSTAVGGAALVFSVFARKRAVERSRVAAATLVRPIVKGRRQLSARGQVLRPSLAQLAEGSCPHCGQREVVALDASASWPIKVRRLYACRHCGYVEGQARGHAH